MPVTLSSPASSLSPSIFPMAMLTHRPVRSPLSR